MEPFLKWAGGKRWLTNSSQDLFPPVESYRRYIEPFLGGGAIFFHLNPTKGILNDINSDLINSYFIIRNRWNDLFDILTEYQILHSKSFYYFMREKVEIDPLL